MTGLAAELRLAPFAHTTAIQVIPTDLANETLRWMESEAPWSLRVAEFYEQWELHLEPSDLPRSLLPLLAPPIVDDLKRAMLGPISDEDLELTEVTAHKLVAGQTIRIHNDYVEGYESHRLLVQLNRGWSDAQGGLLMLFGSARADDVRRLVRPLHASALAFKISANSFHAVSSIQSGERFTLVYSFKTCNHVLSATNDARIPWLLDGVPLRLPLAVGHGWLSGRISSPPLQLRSDLEARGFRFRGDGTGSAALVDAAAGWIRTEPTLEVIAATVVLDVHLLIADPGYDTSHSEPRWRSTIFVSIPERSDSVGALRLAESIIHEAMHLHLTNAEAFAPLVKDFQGQMASPWRMEPRSYQGVAHALFVFTCLAAFFRRIMKVGTIEDSVRRHVRTRLGEIRDEVAHLDFPQLIGGLTERGATMVSHWLQSASARDSS